LWSRVAFCRFPANTAYDTTLSYPSVRQKLTLSMRGVVYDTSTPNSWFFSWTAPVTVSTAVGRFGMLVSPDASGLSCAAARSDGTISGRVNFGATYGPSATDHQVYTCVLDGANVTAYVDGVYAGKATEGYGWQDTVGLALAEVGAIDAGGHTDAQLSSLHIFYTAKTPSDVAVLQAQAVASSYEPPPPRARPPLLLRLGWQALPCCSC
jgi:hypothetical protein